jgi:mycofactocin system transcriptional regulator
MTPEAKWEGAAAVTVWSVATEHGSGRGRPRITTGADIERVAFGLFAERGFAGTTLHDIAAALGVGRRTVLRYYASKNDIPWGEFSETLQGFEDLLDRIPLDLPLHEAVHRGVVAFNTFPEAATDSHRERMRLILTTPELQAHSVQQYAAWRSVIARYVAQRTGRPEGDLLPQLVGPVSLALALSAYDTWLDAEDRPLLDCIDAAMRELRWYIRSDLAP